MFDSAGNVNGGPAILPTMTPDVLTYCPSAGYVATRWNESRASLPRPAVRFQGRKVTSSAPAECRHATRNERGNCLGTARKTRRPAFDGEPRFQHRRAGSFPRGIDDFGGRRDAFADARVCIL